MEAHSIGFADLTQHLLVFSIYIDFKAVRTRNIRSSYVVDVNRNQQQVVVSDLVRVSRRTNLQLTELGNGQKRIIWLVPAEGFGKNPSTALGPHWRVAVGCAFRNSCKKEKSDPAH